MGDRQMYDEMSKEDLIGLIEAQDDELEALQKDFTDLKRKKGIQGTDAKTALDISDLTTENEELREQHTENLATIVKLKDDITEAEARIKSFQDENSNLVAKTKDYLKRIETLEKNIIDITNRSASAEQLSKDAGKQKSEIVKDMKRLLEENDHLREEVIFH